MKPSTTGFGRNVQIWFLAAILALCFTARAFADDPPVTFKLIEHDWGQLYVKVLEELRAGHYKTVETYIDDLVQRKPYSRNGYRILESLYSGLAEEPIGPVLDKWVAASSHHGAMTTRGSFYVNAAWAARGGGLGYTVSADGRKNFKIYLEMAREDFAEAQSRCPQSPCAAAKMITVCKGLGLDRTEMEEWFTKATTADPGAFFPYGNKLDYLSPRWRGTPQKYAEFAQWCYQYSFPGSRVYMVTFDYLYKLADSAKDRRAFFADDRVQATFADIFERYGQDFPNSDILPRLQGMVAEERHDFEAALAFYDKAVAIDPNDINSRRRRADLYFFKIKDGSKAESDYRAILELAPNDSEALTGLGDIALFDQNDYQQAIAYYGEAIQRDPTWRRNYYNRGQARLMLGQYAGALADFDITLRIDPKYYKAYIQRGHLHLRQDQFDAAVGDFNSALALNSRSAEAYYGRGMVNKRRQQWDAAVADFEQAYAYDRQMYGQIIARHMQDIEASKLKSQTDAPPAIGESQPARAATALPAAQPSAAPPPQSVKATAVPPPDPTERLRSKALDLWGKGKRKEAAALFEKVLEKQPQDITALERMADYAKYALRDNDRTLDLLNRLVLTKPQEATYYLKRANFLWSQKRLDLAAEDYHRYLKLSPDWDPQRANALRLLASISEAKKDYDLAVTYYDRLLADNPQDSQAWRLRGMIWYRRKDYKKAAADFSMAISQDPEHNNCYLWRGYCHKYMDRKQAAMEDFKKAYLQEPGSQEGAKRALKELGASVP